MKIIHARIRDEDYQHIQTLADVWEMTMSQMIRKILKEFCEHHKKGEWELDE